MKKILLLFVCTISYSSPWEEEQPAPICVEVYTSTRPQNCFIRATNTATAETLTMGQEIIYAPDGISGKQQMIYKKTTKIQPTPQMTTFPNILLLYAIQRVQTRLKENRTRAMDASDATTKWIVTAQHEYIAQFTNHDTMDLYQQAMSEIELTK
ncbi:MAG: hypothetical protein P4L31_08805 [Candidatus Babeliales bacterium]|nr:hypothetical protein [Candidatus Babeliales bacterium]